VSAQPSPTRSPPLGSLTFVFPHWRHHSQESNTASELDTEAARNFIAGEKKGGPLGPPLVRHNRSADYLVCFRLKPFEVTLLNLYPAVLFSPKPSSVAISR
jgi:hypothetical protein